MSQIDTPRRDARHHHAVVVGIDGSGTAGRALEWAADEAARRGIPLEIVHAWMPPMQAWPVTALAIDPEPLREDARHLVEEAATSIRVSRRADGPKVAARTFEADPVSALLAAAEGRDLLVVGRCGRGGSLSRLIGSVADRVARHASVPVAVIDGQAAVTGGGVVVGVDDSPGARAALAWAADEAGRLDERLVLVHGWDAPSVVPPGGPVFEPLPVGTHPEQSRVLTDRLVAELAEAGHDLPEIEHRAIDLPPSQALIHAAKSARLLVVGSRGRGGFTGLLLGSVSQQSLHHAPCPIVVVPGPR